MGKSRANGGVARSRTAASPVPMATYPAAPRSPAAAVIAGGLLVGALDGLYAVMNMVVIPLSAIDRSPLAFRPALAGAIVHVLLVGIPAALVVRSAGNQPMA